ncbi:MAG: peptide chain release factor N(5)-glutamine methyltransferase [Candidatus Zixiibacteriota bacterium]|nr:MAG: peptide chain release factor N(5)-glutamine methyltransferase [candidate division Zixibacteria bacterium]
MDNTEFHQLISQAENKLRKAGIDTAATEVEIVLQTLLDVGRLDIYLHGPKLLDETIIKKFHEIIDRRVTRYPLQYILGEAYFYGRKFLVDRDVMVPTPETEILCELAINYVVNEGLEYPEILDIGVGAGVISVTIACELPEAWVTAVDISRPTLTVARKNAAMHEVESRINFMKSDLFSSISPEQKYDIILSNPPYISEKVYEELPPEVLADPKISLVSGAEGLDFIKRLIDQAPDYLKKGGRLMFEIGFDQSAKVTKISEADPRYRSFSLMQDLNNIDRVVVLGV